MKIVKGLVVLVVVLIHVSPTSSKKNCFDKLDVPQDAHPKIIKRKFRKLALKYHPDKVAPEEREKAEEKFKELARCYEILADDKKKEKYIASGFDEHFAETGQPGGGGGGGPGGGFGGFNFGGFGDFGDMFSSFFSRHDMNGGGRGNSRHQQFHFGGGGFPGGDDGGFGGFGGFGGPQGHQTQRGRRQQQQATPKRQKSPPRTIKVTLEEILNGGTRSVKISGRNGRPKKVDLSIPKGAVDGQELKVERRKFKVKCAKHKVFRRGSGMTASNLYYTATISLLDALGTATISVPTLEGEMEEVFLGEIVTPKTKKKISGRGLPKKNRPVKRGDLIVEFDIVFPKEMDDSQRKDFVRMANEWIWDPNVKTNVVKDEL